MPRMNRLSVLLSGMCLASCAVGPNYRSPPVVATDHFVAQPLLDARRVGAAAGDTIAPRWWDQFNDPLLSYSVDEALKENLDLARAIARVQQARAALQASTAALLPSGDVTGSATRQKYSLDTPVGEIISNQPGTTRSVNVFEGDVGASWEIDLFGGLRRERESVSDLYQASKVDVSAAQVAIAAQAADTYVTIRGLQARLAIAQEQVDTQRQLLGTVRLQFSKGVAAALQVEQAEGLLAQVEATLPALSSDLDAALNAMDVLLGSQPGTHRDRFAQPTPIPAAPAIASAGGPASLIRRRPDLVVAERQLAASNARIGAALAEYYPKFSLSGLIGTASVQTGQLFTGSSSQWQGLFGLRWRLFDFARVDAEVAAARGRNAEVLATYRQAVLRATEDVEDAFSSLSNSEIQEQILATGETSLTAARDSSVAAYRGGVVSLIEVLDADTRLLATRDARARAQTQAARAAIASYRALGGGWEEGTMGHRI
jgi:NodT family efflux transporter outer membrane factor (OMF) lipoprotein